MSHDDVWLVAARSRDFLEGTRCEQFRRMGVSAASDVSYMTAALPALALGKKYHFDLDIIDNANRVHGMSYLDSKSLFRFWPILHIIWNLATSEMDR